MGAKKPLIIFLIIVIGLFAINESRFLIWDGFGIPPKETSPNCGPENRYKFDVTIGSKQDFVNFLENYDEKILDQYGNKLVRLDNFKDIELDMNYTEISQAEVDWEKVESSIEISTNSALIFNKRVYILDYNPYGCKPNQKHTLKVTDDGHLSVYGCCGI